MVMKILKSKRGSALLFVLIAISVLSLLGISLLSLAVSGFKLKLTERNVRENQYLSESGLDQAYVRVSDVVREAVTDGKRMIDAYISKPIDDIDADENNSLEYFIENERAEEMDSPEDPDHEDYYDSPYIEGTSGTGEVNEEELRDFLNRKFRDFFKDKVDDNLLGKLNSTPYSKMGTGRNKPEISAGSYTKYSASTDEISRITLQSQYNERNITKILAVDLEIKVPDYDQEYTVETVSEVRNPLLNKILAADGDVVILGNNVTINGDIYAGGDMDSDDYYGVAIGDEDDAVQGKLTVKGRIFTGGDITINSDESELVAAGDIYCNNIRFRDVSLGKVVVGTSEDKYNVHTLNSIILDGSGSTMDIYGKYYGFSKGDEIDEVRNLATRSTILINDQYASGESGDTQINITGEETDHDFFPDGTEKPEGNIIAGSNFVPFGPTRPEEHGGQIYQVLYQTGESIAIIGNYEAYSRQLEGTYDPAFNKDKIAFDLISANDAVPAVGFKVEGSDAIEYFDGSDPKNVTLNPGTSEEVKYRLYKGISDKSLYFKNAYDETPEDEKDSFRFDSVKGVDNIIYSMGSFPWFNEASGKIEVLEPELSLDILGLLPDFKQEYQYYVNELGDPELDYRHAGEDRKSVSYFINADVSIANTTRDYAVNNHEIFYKGDNDVIIGSDAYSPDIPSDDEDADRYDVSEIEKGIIYTTGDVYLTGALEYTGTIIAEGDIYILGDQAKNINNVEGSTVFDVAETVFRDYVDMTSVGIGDVFRLSIISESTVFRGSTDPDNLYINFRDIIDTKNWRRIR